jgi:hypothetical protein
MEEWGAMLGFAMGAAVVEYIIYRLTGSCLVTDVLQYFR